MQQVLKALQARKLDRLAAVYVVAAWILVQAASIALPAFGAPAWSLRALIGLLVAGLPLALAGAWVASPHPSTDGAARVASHTDFALLAMLFLVIAAILGEAGYGFFAQPSVPAQPVSAASSPPSTTPSYPSASIAVLPFASMSGDPSNQYFAEGISAELIARLSQDPALRVTARASSFAFQGRNADVRTIADALHVRTILDGSVREEGKRVRIVAELVNTSDGFTIWSHSYDAELTHILDLQDDIALAIGEALTHRLLHPSTLGRPASIDPVAYHKYLQGRYELARHTSKSVASAIALFAEVTRLAPDYADGYAALARAESVSAFNFGDREAIAAGETAVQQTFEIDPANVEALLAHASLALLQWDWTSAAADLTKARNMAGSVSDVLNVQALLFKYLDFSDQSLAAARSAATLDPLYGAAWANVASSLFAAGHYDEANGAAETALMLMPGQPDVLVEQCAALAHGASVDRAQAIAARLTETAGPEHANACLFEIALAGKRMGEAHKLADALAGTPVAGTSGVRETIGQYYLLAGDTNAALDWFERAYERRELGLFAVRLDSATPRALFEMPRWKALWQRPLLKDWQAAHDRIASELANGG